MTRLLWLTIGICVLVVLLATNGAFAVSGAVHLLLVLAIVSAIIFLAARRRVT